MNFSGWVRVTAIAIGLCCVPAFHSGAMIVIWGVGLVPLAILHAIAPGIASARAASHKLATGALTSLGISLCALAGLFVVVFRGGHGANLVDALPYFAAIAAAGLVLSLPGIAVALAVQLHCERRGKR